jgi:uncharacterized membrane protein YkvA (DUF1232 family)
MSTVQIALLALAVFLVAYAGFIVWLLAAGRRTDARALAGFIPDCIVLFRRLLGDPRISRWRKALLVGLLAYLASPIDLVPDFFPVVGQLDDLIIVAVVLRSLLRGGGADLVREHWPGPDSSRELVIRLAFGG